jgi:HEPN domain-containing protein
MTRDSARLELAQRWLVLAARDLSAADYNAAAFPTNSVFLSQAAEKASKGLLAGFGASTPKIHDIKALGDAAIEFAPALSPLFDACAGLTDYAVVFRYLDAPYEPDETEARAVIAKATALYDAIRSELGL